VKSPKSAAAADLDNRSRLLHAATDAFAEQGFDGTSLRTIADSAGVSFQLIAYYFGSKEALWVATVDYLFERYLETGKGLGFTPSGNLHEQFHNHLRLLLTDMLQRPQLHKICIQEHLANSPRFHNTIAPKLEQLFATLALPYFREVVRLGIVERFTPEETCLLWSSVCRANLSSPDFVEYTLHMPADSAKAVEQQVDLMYAILTERVAAGTAEQNPVKGTPPAPVEKRPGTPRLEAVVYPWRDTREAAGDAGRVKQLETENQQLKQLIGSLSLEKKLLLDRLTELQKKA
jgi:AcrR family transcriptional regulator